MSPERLAVRAAENGYKSLALADTSDLGGSIRFTLEAERVGLKPIIGAELLVDGFTVVLLARCATGYRNLSALVSASRVGQLGAWELDRGSGIGDRGSGIGDRGSRIKDQGSQRHHYGMRL